MMMKNSCPLLLLGTACLILLLLVQEGHGLKCYVGNGFVQKENKREELDCSTIEQEDAVRLHPSCKKEDESPADPPERDCCVTQTTVADGGNHAYDKYCGCSKGKGLEDSHQPSDL